MSAREPTEDRFWKYATPEPNSGCWLWTGYFYPNGYGAIKPSGKRVNISAHRLSYQMFKGDIPAGLQIDHLCRNRGCVNPDHLEAVTCRENLLRGDTITARRAAVTHCPKGHEYSVKNTYVDSKNCRHCRACGRIYSQRKRLQNDSA